MGTVELKPVVFNCENEQLVGVLHIPDPAMANTRNRGVLIVVGGPQYRVGSHRQFLLLARYLAKNGIPVMRFDYRGMGDSTGELKDFEGVDSDVAAAMDTFYTKVPDLEEVVIWGLCDAASAALFYAHKDPRVQRLILINPWVRTEQGEAKAFLKKYYLKRFFSKALWLKILRGGFNPLKSMGSFAENINKATKNKESPEEILSLPDRMLRGLNKFDGKILVILSGNDLTAEEYRNLIASSSKWQLTLGEKQLETKQLELANHTFSSNVWRTQVEDWTLAWVRQD